MPPAAGEQRAFRLALAESNPGLYRDMALYLQVLREGLPASIAQVCFHLATQTHPERYAALDPARRRDLHRRLEALGRRCCSLLTVEQISHLASRLERDRLQQRRERRQLLLERLSRAAPDPLDEPSQEEGGGAAAGDLPEGSVRLGLGLPLGGGWLDWGEAGGAPIEPSAAPAREDQPWPGIGGGLADSELPSDSDSPEVSGAEPDREEGSAETGELQSPVLLAGFLEDFAAAMGLPPSVLQPASAEDQDRPAERQDTGPSGASEPPPDLASAPPIEVEGSGAPEDASLAAFHPPLEGGLLPRDPILLLAWLEAFEQALARRLRNLSNAINLELLRCGLIQVLLPLSLLDAVLAGQVESQSSKPNLLRVQLPPGLGPLAGHGRIEAVLMRCSDLELEQPRFCNMRRRLQQRRLESRRMAQQYHRLQRRLLAREAEALWLQDIRATGPNRRGPRNHP
jgi:hypothetical protein